MHLKKKINVSYVVDKLQKQLTVTQELLAEVMPDCSEESAKAFSELQGTEEVFQKLEKELRRYLQQCENSLCVQRKTCRSHLCIQNGSWSINGGNSPAQLQAFLFLSMPCL